MRRLVLIDTLIHINSQWLVVEINTSLLLPANSREGPPVVEQSRLRFVVGTFESWSQLRAALRDLRTRGLVLDSFNCLALQRLFAGKTVVAPNQQSVKVEMLPFAEAVAPIACT